jgi:hypothetical protein
VVTLCDSCDVRTESRFHFVVLLSTFLHAILHPSHHLLNVLLQTANKLGLSKKKKKVTRVQIAVKNNVEDSKWYSYFRWCLLNIPSSLIYTFSSYCYWHSHGHHETANVTLSLACSRVRNVWRRFVQQHFTLSCCSEATNRQSAGTNIDKPAYYDRTRSEVTPRVLPTAGTKKYRTVLLIKKKLPHSVKRLEGNK